MFDEPVVSGPGTPSCCRRGPFRFAGGRIRVTFAPSVGAHVISYTQDGTRRQKRRSSHREAIWVAEELEADYRQQLHLGEPGGFGEQGLTVAALCRRWLEATATERGNGASYRRKQRSIIDAHVESRLDVRAADWTVADTEDVLAGMARERYSASQRAHVLTVLRQAARWGLRRGYVTADPCAGVRTPSKSKSMNGRAAVAASGDGQINWASVQRRPTTAAVEAVTEQLEAVGRLDDALLVQLCAYVGLRHAEALALTGHDIDLATGSIAVVRQVDHENQALHTANGVVLDGDGELIAWANAYGSATLPKWRSDRTAFIPAHVRPRLEESLERHQGGLLLPSTSGTYRRARTNWAMRHWTPARLRAGWPVDGDGRPVWDVHELRHHAASWMLESLDLPVADVAAILGHATPELTWRMYVTPDDGVAGRAACASEAWMPPSSI